MKITINIDPDLNQEEIIINCQNMTQKLEQMIASLRAFDLKLTGSKQGSVYILDLAKILYIDTIDRKVFLYTKEDVYETPLKLYELEERLQEHDFFRASKSAIINLQHVQSLKVDIGGKLLLNMDNGEKLIVSRQYAKNIKERLGV